MRTVCIYHSQDLDGWMSAAIVKHFWKDTCNWAGDTLDFIGYNYGDPIPDLSEYDKVIMCDSSFSEYDRDNIICEDNQEHRLIWIDHHISAINLLEDNNYDGLRGINFAACELTWKYFFPNETIPEIVRLLGLYDSFRHKGTDEETKVIEFQYGARQCITNYEEAYYYLMLIRKPLVALEVLERIQKQGKIIYQYLCMEAKQIYKSRFRIVFEEYREDLKLNPFNPEQGSTMQYEFICINKERFNPINFGIDYHQEVYGGCACFWYNGSEWCFSLYNENGKVDCSKLAAQFKGGGHAGAAGFRIKDIDKFFKEHKINKNEPLA